MATVFEHILVTTDFSDCSQPAIDEAIELALAFEARLTLVHVWQFPVEVYGAMSMPVDWTTSVEAGARKALDGALEGIRKRVPRADAMLRSGQPAQEIVDAAKQSGADIVVIGTHGRSGFLEHLMLGSVAERVVRTCSVPVLTVRGPAQKPRRSAG